MLETHSKNDPNALRADGPGENDANYLNGGEITDLLDVKRKRTLAALEQVNFNISKASSLLGISRSTLYRRMKNLGLLS
jgi:transcriptional regulator of acetoin/glycerol metabolism